jgi:hypothetical protein
VTLLPKGCDRPALGSREAEIRTGSSWFGENRWESEQAQRVWQAGQDSGSGNQIVTHFEVYPERPADSTLLLPLDRGAPTEVGRNPAPGGRRCEVLFARAKKPDKRWGCGGCRCPTRKLPVANTSFFNTSVGFVAGKSGKPAPGEESACSNWFGRHAAMGRAGRDGGRFHPDGGLSCATEHELAQSARVANENGYAQNRHRRLYPFRAMLPGLCQKVHFCDGK